MKYQLIVHWKDGSGSGRVIDISWPLTQDLSKIKSVKLVPFKPIRESRPRSRSARDRRIGKGADF